MTRQLLAFSRKQLIQPEVLDLNELLTNLEKMLRRLIGEDIELSIVPDRSIHRVKLDPGQFEQIVINLAVNARDAMPRGGHLTVETSQVELDDIYAAEHVAVVPGQYVLVTVSDTGRGMTREVRERVFEPFFSTKSKDQGTGLGLSTVYGIVKQHGGSVWAYGEPGTGATFKIYLPIHVEDGSGGQALLDSEEARAVRGGDETLLIVEDEPAVRSLVNRLLSQLGYRLILAQDGLDACRLAGEHPGPIHLLLTDVVMPRLSGPDVARHLTAERPDLKVLYMSGYTDNAIAKHGILEEGIQLLQKPFSMSQLAQHVRQVLDA